MKNVQKNRIAGALFGVAVGDALGGPVEFMSAAQIARTHGRVSSMIGGGWLGLIPGEVTDDTQMTLCVAEGIVEAPFSPIEAVGRRFISWANSRPKDIGSACAASIRNAQRIGRNVLHDNPTAEDWEQASAETQRSFGHPVEGNGALMRTVYPGLYYKDSSVAEYWAMKIGQMTHAGPRSTGACVLYAHMIHLLTASEISIPLEHDAQRPVQAFLLDQCEGEAEYQRAVRAETVEEHDGGYVVDSMKIALGSLATSSTFAEAVETAVNLGGDADTNAAITGGLAGAWYGYDAIPAEWIAYLSDDVKAQLLRLADAAFEAREG